MSTSEILNLTLDVLILLLSSAYLWLHYRPRFPRGRWLEAGPARLHVGQVVRLSSGGPLMTVADDNPNCEGRLWCRVFIGGRYELMAFNKAELVLRIGVIG